jgi:hypothetical protein
MSSGSISRLRLEDSAAGRTGPRLGGRRSDPPTFNDRWNNALAFGGLATIIGIVLLLLLNR